MLEDSVKLSKILSELVLVLSTRSFRLILLHHVSRSVHLKPIEFMPQGRQAA